MRVYEIMSAHLKTVPLTTGADAAWAMMRADRIHHLVVMDGRKVAGVFSARDAGGANGAPIRAGRLVGELMSQHMVTAPKNTPLKRVANGAAQLPGATHQAAPRLWRVVSQADPSADAASCRDVMLGILRSISEKYADVHQLSFR